MTSTACSRPLSVEPIDGRRRRHAVERHVDERRHPAGRRRAGGVVEPFPVGTPGIVDVTYRRALEYDERADVHVFFSPVGCFPESATHDTPVATTIVATHAVRRATCLPMLKTTVQPGDRRLADDSLSTADCRQSHLSTVASINGKASVARRSRCGSEPEPGRSKVADV
jgi:hypothetical protein